MDTESEQFRDTTTGSTTTPNLGPMPEFPTLQVYDRDQVNTATTEELRAMVWQMSQSIAMLNKLFGKVMGAWQQREAILLEQLHASSTD